MENSNYDFGEDFYLKAKGRFGRGFKHTKGKDMHSILVSLVHLTNSIKKEYGKCVSNDGRIVGTERSVLLKKTDSLIQMIILCIRDFLLDETINIASDSGNSMQLTISFEQDAWSLTGMMPYNFLEYEGTLARYYQEVLLKNLTCFFLELKKASVDRVIASKEREIIISMLRDVLIGALKMYYLLYHLKINE
jgi:hypothetical protein